MGETVTVVDVLNRILYIEYASIWHYPRVAEKIADKEAKEYFIQLGEDSMRHADEGIRLIRSFGGEPLLKIDDVPEEDIFCILQHMLEMEKLAAWLYRQATGLTDNDDTKKLLLEQAHEEELHAKSVEKILMRLA
jgi:bacterioferritin (cytochrome b1)